MPAEASALEATLSGLGDILRRMKFVHDVEAGSDDPEKLRTRLVNHIDDYLLPRVRDSHAPLLAVVGGSTGAGKSTLVNSLLGEVVTRSGAVRPTTRTPVLVHHPSDAQWFTTQRILPTLARLRGDGFAGGQGLQRTDALLLIAHEAVPAGMALLDAPDVDSVADENRQLADQLLNAADLWLFVTTANRYADAVPWALLDSAGQRAVTVSVVLNRVPAGAESEIVPDLTAVLSTHSVDSQLLRVINEVQLTSEGLIPKQEIRELESWLASIAASAAERQRIAAQTLRGALERLAVDVESLLQAANNQDQHVQALESNATERFAIALEHIFESLHDGALLRGEILARWQDFVGAGELMRGIEGTIGRIRDRVTGFFGGKPPRTHKVENAIETGLHTVLVNEISKACHDVDRAWIATALGTELLLETSSPRPSQSLPAEASETIRAWQADVLEMIRAEGEGKRKTARIAAFGVNGIAVALMVVVFASTAGLTGLEIGIAGGSAVVGQKLLEAIFGEDAVRRMAQRASTMLQDHCRQLVDQNLKTYTGVTGHVLGRSVSADLAAQVNDLGRGGDGA